MRRVGATLALVAGLACAAPAGAAAPLDPRIRVLPYDTDRVIALDAAFGFQTMIQFGPDEQIQNVSIGDGAAWQITPNKSATLIFVKPIDLAAQTNMTVVTDKRAYLFELSAHAPGARGEPPYVIRFSYPPPPAAPARADVVSGLPPPARRHADYAYTGARTNLPAEVFDDGELTYFRWPRGSATPALFVVGPDGQESVANYSVRDGYQVVEQVAPRFVLRDGRAVTVVINEGWREPPPGRDAPRPADARTARAAARADAHDDGGPR